MKKLFALLIVVSGLFFYNTVHAQERTKIADGITLVRYGNVTVIEDDINQKTWQITVTREKKESTNQGSSIGDWIYKVTCGNSYTKAATKATLSAAISGAISSITGGTGAALSGFVNSIASTIYDDVCDYFGEKRK